MGRILRWLWPEFVTIEDAERALQGAARIWLLIAVIGLIVALAPAVAAIASDRPDWPLTSVYTVDHPRVRNCRGAVPPLAAAAEPSAGGIAAAPLYGDPRRRRPKRTGDRSLQPRRVGGIGLVTVHALRAANAWHSFARSRVQWDHFGIAAVVFLALFIGSIAIDPENALSWDYPQVATWRSWASMLLENAAVLATMLVTRWMPVVSVPGGPPSAAVPTGAA